MTKILNHINTYANLTAYNNDKDKNYPNIAYIQETNEVKWVKENQDIVEGIVVCKYNVTSTSEETFILGTTTGIKYQIIDDVKQDTVKDAYTFDTLGEHTVKYQFDGTSISDRAFEGCTDLTSVSIGNSVTSIGSYAFSDCSKLTSVTIPNSVTEIGADAFYGCSGLTSITIPDSVNSIGGGSFQECSGLTSITIPDSVNSIGDGSFSNCSGLTSITIGNGVTSIGNNSFGGCSSLTSIVIPKSVISIGNDAFNACSSLESIVVDSANTVFDSRENCNAIIHTSTNKLISGCKNTVIPNTVTSIGNSAYRGCTMTSIVIPNSVREIGNNAFLNCNSLTSMEIPNSVTSIGISAFQNCRGLTSVTIQATTPPSLDSFAFDNTNNCRIYVPAESVDAYKNATNWSALSRRIKAIVA